MECPGKLRIDRGLLRCSLGLDCQTLRDRLRFNTTADEFLGASVRAAHPNREPEQRSPQTKDSVIVSVAFDPETAALIRKRASEERLALRSWIRRAVMKELDGS